ncbi:MAG: hypothetical protein OEY89_13965 [Gammaproteobacteria bacterium]|nr:hypothetical protein [Gammaproteobacteria bacterium]
MMKTVLTAYFLLFSLSTGAYAESDIYTITAQQWTMPRQDTVLIEFPPLQQAVAKFKAQPGSRLLIRYPGGDEGSLWLNELQSWLVALGIASKDMELIPGSSRQTVIEMEVVAENKNIVTSEQRNKSLNLSGVK